MKTLLSFILLLSLLTACSGTAAPAALPVSPTVPAFTTFPAPAATETPQADLPSPSAPAPVRIPSEQPVILLPLEGPAAQRNAEFSGLAWYGERLILLPQYPSRFSAQANGADGALFVLTKDEILAALDASPVPALTPRPLPVWWGNLTGQVRGFEGFEALAIAGDTACLTIEASPAGMKGYLVCGALAPDLSALRLDPATLTEIPLPAQVSNKSDEALLALPDGSMAAFYEVNGAQLTPSPFVSLFSPAFEPAGSVPFPRLEYRLTDVTAQDSEGVFWGINYFYPGDTEQRTADDPLAARYGLGASHTPGGPVERLVALRWTAEGLTLLDMPPLYLQLLPGGEARNWEGLVRLEGRGFLLVTDKYPQTLLGFVPLK
ncbi:MAG: hypothetical protein Fur0018_04240 [Anaerolineales bacterium]